MMGFDEKVDVIDLIINVLRDHEKTLDELISKLEGALEAAPIGAEAARAVVRKPAVSVLIRRWADFRVRSVGASIVAFDIEDKRFNVSAVKEGVLHSYQEAMPDMEIRFREKEEGVVIDGIDLGSVGLVPTVLRGRLECGLEVSVRGAEVDIPDGGAIYKVLYDIDADGAMSWLAYQLKVERKNIFQGKVQI
jgi:hypothetical protein